MSTKPITWNKDRPATQITPTFRYILADNPTYTAVGLKVTFPPGASYPPHRHGTANVIAMVIEGTCLSGMNDSEAQTYKVGETCDNASETEIAVIVVTFIVKTEILESEGLGVLVKVEPEYMDGAMEQMARCGTMPAL
ncbi:hypothetical protein BJ875DRAFT_381607 [Amylocarpus encephaloides]|uniref:Cupin 2 conserved barrel domain-containing protein n=1 Tax=Amylocarpus encephaloides TaxID=45428 RepID=A0A9P7YF56_9HELO|nr:hypothetical protein BJ875DRAFT_381607 [Amylocarpus encephaloides]